MDALEGEHAFCDGQAQTFAFNHKALSGCLHCLSFNVELLTIIFPGILDHVLRTSTLIIGIASSHENMNRLYSKVNSIQFKILYAGFYCSYFSICERKSTFSKLL